MHRVYGFVDYVNEAQDGLYDTRSLPVPRSRPLFPVETPTSRCPICSQSVPLPGTCYSDWHTHLQAHDQPPEPFLSLQAPSPTFWCERCSREIPTAGKNSAEQQDHLTAHEIGQEIPNERDERMRRMIQEDEEMLRNAWNRSGFNEQVYADAPYEPSGKAGLSAEEVRQVVEVNFPETTNMTCECVICKEELHAGERVKILPCAHLFHPTCIDQWLSKHAQCPIDRMQLGYQ